MAKSTFTSILNIFVAEIFLSIAEIPKIVGELMNGTVFSFTLDKYQF
jgi:hypothetical protein